MYIDVHVYGEVRFTGLVLTLLMSVQWSQLMGTTLGNLEHHT